MNCKHGRDSYCMKCAAGNAEPDTDSAYLRGYEDARQKYLIEGESASIAYMKGHDDGMRKSNETPKKEYKYFMSATIGRIPVNFISVLDSPIKSMKDIHEVEINVLPSFREKSVFLRDAKRLTINNFILI